MIKSYNKLVRDRIPDIIEASGAECKTEILSDEKYLEMIDAKLDEELETVRAKKAEKRGGFEKKILLIETIEK